MQYSKLTLGELTLGELTLGELTLGELNRGGRAEETPRYLRALRKTKGADLEHFQSFHFSVPSLQPVRSPGCVCASYNTKPKKVSFCYFIPDFKNALIFPP